MKQIPELSVKDVRRFTRHYLHGADDCWPWQGDKNDKGYGRFYLRGKMYLTHRIAWTIAHGEIPYGLRVLHHCDNPPCCNPKHLFLGTLKDNNVDCAKKNRSNPPWRTHCINGHPYEGENVYARPVKGRIR